MAVLPKARGGKPLGGGARAFSLISLVSVLAAWLLLTWALGPQVFPGPGETLAFLSQEARGPLWYHLGMTLLRVGLAFALALALGAGVGILVGLYRAAERLLEAWVALGLNLPRILPLVMAYLLLGLNEQAAVLALVIILAPQVVVQVREGVRALDTKLLEMARAFRRPRTLVLRRVVLPQLLPYFVGAARSTLALAWKMVVLAELLGRTSGVGYQINFYFQMFEMRGILAYGLAMTLVLALVDKAFVLLGERLARWRRPVEGL
ncbi:ABC transporter permease [Thermus oshimai]|jgi:NitT/TauT family transport system permease protein